MKLKYTLGALSAGFALASCSLDVNMYDGVTGEDVTARNIVELSQGSYSMLKYDGGLIDNGYYFWAYGADDLSWGGTSTDAKFDIYDYSRNINSSITEYAWELGYRTIGNCNKVIEMGAELGSNITDEEKVIVGENYYLRALSYFLLVNEFAQPYSNNPTQNPGLPLKLTSNPDDLPQSRSTVAEVYDQVVKDLQDAITYMTLPAGMSPKNSCYATKEAAQALLARVYLYMENWDGAWNMANEVINSGRFELLKGDDYKIYSQFVPEDNSETIFAVRRTKLKDDGGYGRMGGLYIQVDNSGWEEVYASAPYLNLLELYLDAQGYPKDLRSNFITKRYVEDGTDTSKYPITGNPERNYKDWTFVYAAKQAGANANYEYRQISVTKQNDGTYAMGAEDAANFQSATIQSEPYNLGTRYYVQASDGTKYIGRIEPRVYDARTLRQKEAMFLVYAINKCSYQEQYYHLWSPIISRLAEMYLIRAEANLEKGGSTQTTLDDVNVIRKRAGIPEWTLENIQTAENGQPKDIHKIIEEERMLEFAWEGLRRFDVFRWRHTLDRKYPGGHTLRQGDRYLEIPYNSPSVCEFIPQAQYDAYPYDLGQNP
ncbi:RagB/SusD family nutrient uptake outer membrane protein [Bacteroides mediterraneensis]|uniref:RagB/SusD family nutrient uptake outer membrane protein n=1 Tax=Bacteroides mediterraneensis TaxID=1841856 RepID=A0ABS2ESH9_9BACE|nr:RagB/SusD family nutrient uptake outer membrane protein [Bacteroides mediterraneensis]MBM6757577.1 RagB/SusD family nutrient uptake outer membrane protein [Bacteroides mediterraneensis]